MEVLKGMAKITAHIEREMALKCWSLLHQKELTQLAKDYFDSMTAEVYFNTSSGFVFLSDENMNTIMVNDDNGKLDLFISTSEEGHEGFFDELMDDWDNHCKEDKKQLWEIATEEQKETHKKLFKGFK